MKRILRLIFSFIVLLFLIMSMIIAYLIFFVDPNKFKPMIVSEVMKKTGYRLNIEGNLSWSFYPSLGIQAERMGLRAPNQNIDFLNLQKVTISTKLFSLLRDYHQLTGKINVDQVLLGQLRLQAVNVDLRWQNHTLLFQPIKARLYGGSLTGVIEGKNLNQSLKWNWQIQLKDVEINSLLKDLNNAHAKLTVAGQAQVDFKGSTIGKNKKTMTENLNGVLSFKLNQGILEGLDLNYLIKKVETFIQDRKFILNQEDFSSLSRQTVFHRFTGSAIIKNGIAQSNDLLLVSMDFTTKGMGKIDLINQRINYQLQVLPVHTSKLPWVIPIMISGDIRKPQVRLDLVALNTIIVKEQLEKAKIKIEKHVKELPDKAEQLLNKLLR